MWRGGAWAQAVAINADQSFEWQRPDHRDNASRLISTIQHSVSFSTVSLSRIAGGSFPTLQMP